jgi:hypothetical protein
VGLSCCCISEGLEGRADGGEGFGGWVKVEEDGCYELRQKENDQRYQLLGFGSMHSVMGGCQELTVGERGGTNSAWESQKEGRRCNRSDRQPLQTSGVAEKEENSP